MSAYVVGKPHIDALVTLATDGPSGYHGGPGGAWSGHYYVKDTTAELGWRAVHVKDEQNRVGQMLVSENIESVWHRYPDDKTIDDLPGPVDKSSLMAYRFERRRRNLTAIEGLVAISGYEYQSCEHPGWDASEAHAFCEWLRGSLISRLPGYEEARTWEVDDDEPPTPAAPAPVALARSLTRDETIRAIRTALRRRTGHAWSVTGGRGTAWGWIHVNVPPARRVEYGCMTDHDRAELGRVLGLAGPAHSQGVSIPAGSDFWAEYIDRAEGRTPATFGVRYWD